VASAIMTVTTAKVAGCRNIAVPRRRVRASASIPAIVFAAKICGADQILAVGGVQGVAAMAFGLFGLPKANIIVGPGNQFVAEAKRMLFGRVGIDMIAGPTDSLILADHTATRTWSPPTSWPGRAWLQLAGLAGDGFPRPGRDRHEAAGARTDRDLPELNRENAAAAWRDYAEVIVCADREEMAATSDDYAPEHLTVQAEDLDWWLDRLSCYGSLFLGEETTVAFGDKAAGTNHVLPTSGAASYTGGLSVHKYMKIVTWQRATKEGAKPVADRHGAHLPARRHGGACPRRRCAACEVFPRRKLRPDRRGVGDGGSALFDLEGHVACVTGASSGLGRRARWSSPRGRVGRGVARRAEALDSLAAEAPGPVAAIPRSDDRDGLADLAARAPSPSARPTSSSMRPGSTPARPPTTSRPRAGT
jgi:hypothetical protein